MLPHLPPASCPWQGAEVAAFIAGSGECGDRDAFGFEEITGGAAMSIDPGCRRGSRWTAHRSTRLPSMASTCPVWTRRGRGRPRPLVVEDRVRLRPGDQGAVGVVRPVGEGLGSDGQPGLGGDAVGHAAGESEEDQGVIDGLDGVDDDLRLRLIVDDRVVETTVRFDVGDGSADGRGQSDKGADLVFDLGLQSGCGHVEGATAEAFVIVVAGVGADDDSALRGGVDGGADALGVAGMESAGDVGAGDQAEHGRIVADDAIRDVLPEVRVEVDSRFAVGRHCHPPIPIIAKMGPMDWWPCTT